MEDRELTEKIISAAFKVHNTLGSGILEKIYENAMFIEIRTQGLPVNAQVPIQVMYEGNPVGDYVADLLVADRVVVEIKAIAKLLLEHEKQLVNYLVATGLDTGLLINFGPSVEVKRKYRKTKRSEP